MLTSNTYKKLLIGCVIAMMIGLAAETALSQGYIYDKWSATSLTWAICIAISIGFLMIAALYLTGGMLSARYYESSTNAD